MSPPVPGLGPVTDLGRAGRVLAARWSIERLRRPTGPEVVWLGYAKPEVSSFECLACGESGFKQGVCRIEGRNLYICPACASHQVHPLPPPSAAPTGFGRRFLLERAEPVREAALELVLATGGREPGALLDLDCGLGLRVEIASAAPGWRACGLDPGVLAELGREVFGADLRRGGAEALGAMLPGARFDVILCEGAVGRSADPKALLAAARARAAPDARWLLATADAATLYASDDPATIRALVPADRVLLPSRFGLIHLLHRAGFAECGVEQTGGKLRADRERRWPRRQSDAVAAEALLDTYLERRLAALPADASAALAFQVAALERVVARQDWPAGQRLLGDLSGALVAASEAARTADADDILHLFRRAPFCSVALLHQAGLVQMHAQGPSTQALMCFELAALLASQTAALAPGLADQGESFWSARFHAAVVTRHLGDTARALAMFAAVSSGQGGPPASPAWAARAAAEIEAATAAPGPAKPVPAASAPRSARARKPRAERRAS